MGKLSLPPKIQERVQFSLLNLQLNVTLDGAFIALLDELP